jgi:hypothetical protein
VTQFAEARIRPSSSAVYKVSLVDLTNVIGGAPRHASLPVVLQGVRLLTLGRQWREGIAAATER